MTVDEIRAKARRLTKTNTTSYTDANMLIDLNLAQKKVVNLIMRYSNYKNDFIVEKFLDHVATDDLVAGDLGYNGEYPFEITSMRPVRFEVAYSSTEDHKPAIIKQINQTDTTQIVPEGSTFTVRPTVFYTRNSYFVRPLLEGTTDVAGGIHAWWQAVPDDVDDGADVPAGNLLVHEIYPYIIALDYFEERPDKFNSRVAAGFDEAVDELKAFYANRMDITHTMTTPKHNWK